MKSLSPAQKGALMRCPEEWENWGISTRHGQRLSGICRAKTLDILVERGLAEVENNMGIYWRRTAAAGPQPEDICIDVGASIVSSRNYMQVHPAPHVKAWLNENAPSGWYYVNLLTTERNHFEIHFADYVEAVMFKLRWM